MKLKELFSLLEGISPQEKDNLQQELANKDINSVHRDGKIHVHPDDHSIAKKVAKRLGLEKHVVKGLKEEALEEADFSKHQEIDKAEHDSLKDKHRAGKSGESTHHNTIHVGADDKHRYIQTYSHKKHGIPSIWHVKDKNGGADKYYKDKVLKESKKEIEFEHNGTKHHIEHSLDGKHPIVAHYSSGHETVGFIHHTKNNEHHAKESNSVSGTGLGQTALKAYNRNIKESDESISEGELKGNWTLEKVKNLTTQQRKVLAKNAATAKDNQVLAMIDIANQSKAKVSTPKVDQGKLLDEIWMMVQQEVGHSVPDGDPIDRIHPALKRIMKKHDISFDDWDTTKWLDKAAKANNYKSYDAFVQDMIDEYKRVNEGYPEVDHMPGRRLSLADTHKTSKYTVATNAKDGHKEHRIEVEGSSENHAKNLAAEHFVNKLGLKPRVHFDGVRIVK